MLVVRFRVLSKVQKVIMARQASVLAPAGVDDFQVKNEPVLTYLKGSKERSELESAIKQLSSETQDIPIIIGGQEIRNSDVQYQVSPFDHQRKVAKFYYASKPEIQKAIDNSLAVRMKWEQTPVKDRIALFIRAGDLIATKYRYKLNAAAMLGQAKNTFQAEIDAACESADFMRFNGYFAKELLKYQPLSPTPNEILNSMRFRGLEGFVAAISPFNFTAIGCNLASSPTVWGNVVLWKPSETAMLSNYIIYQVFQEAGFPPGVINFVPSRGPDFGDVITKSPYLAGINFTGSIPTFQLLWKLVGDNLPIYTNYPRLVGECGGKNFHLIHKSAELKNAVMNTVRSAFEYNGQKCSACSRVYISESIWPKFKEDFLAAVKQIKLGSPLEYDTFVSAVIDERSFKRISGYLEHAKSNPNVTVLAGGNTDMSKGYFVEPTVIQTTDPKDRLMCEEIFGPVLTIYVYKDSELDKTMDLINSSIQGLTGAIFGQDQEFLKTATEKLKQVAGNFYINDKSTGAVVGQQPFGGGRLSGTNDKAGAPYYLVKWANPQAIKENFAPLTDFKYPYMSN